MAGTFTHWMIIEEALEKYKPRDEYYGIILRNNHFVNLGAVGPDYPYLTDLLGHYLKIHSWSDRMHYENTGEMLKIAATELLKLKRGPEFEICLAWFCGFISHLVADSVVHPVVNAIVGPYIFNSGEHRHCEMIQDSFIFKEIKDRELQYSDYIEILRQCSDKKNENRINPAIRKFWTKILKLSYPDAKDRFKRIDPDVWHKNFLSRIGGAQLLPVFRHYGEEKNMAYKSSGDIDADEKQRFIEGVKLPGGGIGDFRKDVFDKAAGEVICNWKRLFKAIKTNRLEVFFEHIRNWNLDTGVDEDEIFFWPKG